MFFAANALTKTIADDSAVAAAVVVSLSYREVTVLSMLVYIIVKLFFLLLLSFLIQLCAPASFLPVFP